jgi:hypothetical protein
MAQQQFNDWDPTRSGLEGNMMAQPRVFAHDAAEIGIGALNCSDANFGILITNGGTGFYPAPGTETITITHAGGNAVITVLEADPTTGAVLRYKINCDDAGDNYAVGQTFGPILGSIAGTLGSLTVTNIDIPNTQQRGCCLYNGSAAAQDIEVVMESAIADATDPTGYATTVTFPNVPSGSFLPIEVVQLVSGSDVLALY